VFLSTPHRSSIQLRFLFPLEFWRRRGKSKSTQADRLGLILIPSQLRHASTIEISYHVINRSWGKARRWDTQSILSTVAQRNDDPPVQSGGVFLWGVSLLRLRRSCCRLGLGYRYLSSLPSGSREGSHLLDGCRCYAGHQSNDLVSRVSSMTITLQQSTLHRNRIIFNAGTPFQFTRSREGFIIGKKV
jgi:hypothetical protein